MIEIAVSGVQDVEALREALEKLPTLYRIDLVSLDDCANERYNEPQGNQYNQYGARNDAPVVTDIRRDGDGLVNVSPVGSSMGTDYDPKATADKYRRM